mgnify:CR=1 FL=1
MSDWFDQYYGCDGPCPEYERIVNTPQIYSSITEDFKSCLPTPTSFDCSLITHCISGGTGGSVRTPISIVSNSMHIEKPKAGKEYIGNENSGFNSGSGAGAWNLPIGSFTMENINCGVPFPHNISGSLIDAINVCGNLFIGGHTDSVTVTLKIYRFECTESGTPEINQMASTTINFPVAEEGDPGVNRCWHLNVAAEDPVVECTTHFLISFGIAITDTAKILKSSYKATIEKVA